MSGKLVHFEIPYDDRERANAFYGDASVDDALKAVEAAGGAVVKERFAVGEMGFCGYFTDTEGNLLGVWENA